MFTHYGIPVPNGVLAFSAEEVYEFAKKVQKPVMIKAQALISDRGNFDGIKRADTPTEARFHAAQILGQHIYEYNVDKLLVDELVGIKQEMFLAITNDRATGKAVIVASERGGTDIETIAQNYPDTIVREQIEPLIGLQKYQLTKVASNISLPRALWGHFFAIAEGLYACFLENDAVLTEINPLAWTLDDRLMALDGKLIIDDNALYKHPELAEMRDVSMEHNAETRARNAGLSYVKLKGQIGCIVNGAGLALTIMDLIHLYGNNEFAPANFLDVGGGARADQVIEALQIILSDTDVQSILITIFGGITRCDEVARGIIDVFDAAPEPILTPLVVRLRGTHAEDASAILRNAKIPCLIEATTLTDAAQKAISAAKGC